MNSLSVAVPSYVFDTAAATILRVRPGRLAAVLEREVEAFRVNLIRQGQDPDHASYFARQFATVVESRLDAAGGATTH